MLLAEVMDKYPTITQIWCVFAAFGLIGFRLGMARRWLCIAPLVLAGLFAIGLWIDFNDPFVGPAIVNETGMTYIQWSYAASAAGVILPVFGAFAGLLRDRRYCNKSAAGYTQE